MIYILGFDTGVEETCVTLGWCGLSKASDDCLHNGRTAREKSSVSSQTILDRNMPHSTEPYATSTSQSSESIVSGHREKVSNENTKVM